MEVVIARLALVLFGLMVATLAACGGDDDDAPDASATPAGAIATRTPAPERTPTPRAASTPSVTPTPDREGRMPYTGFQLFGDFETRDPVDFPEDLMMLVETGCTQCDGPTQALYRVWRNDGETHVEHLIDAGISGSENTYITSFALKPDMSDIVVTICTDCGGRGRPLTASPVTVFRSMDGGRSWSSIYTTERGHQVFAQAITSKGIVTTDFGGENLRYLDGDEIERPEDAEELHYEARRAGELWWIAGEGSEVLNADGTTLAIVEPGATIDSVVIRWDWRQPRPVTSWSEAQSGPRFGGWNVTMLTSDYGQLGFNSDIYVSPVVILDDGSILGRLSSEEIPYGGTIGFIDASTGDLTPIHGPLREEPFGNGEFASGRNALQAAVEGPFLRITTGTPCVEIRTGTDSQAEALTCAADGVLVHDLDSTVTVGAQTWHKVRLLDGREGYVGAEDVSGE